MWKRGEIAPKDIFSTSLFSGAKLHIRLLNVVV